MAVALDVDFSYHIAPVDRTDGNIDLETLLLMETVVVVLARP